MNVKVEALDQHKVSLAIELPAEAVQKGFKQAVARIANQVRIPGFRKGKASRKVLEMHFGKEAVVAEAKDIVINGSHRSDEAGKDHPDHPGGCEGRSLL